MHIREGVGNRPTRRTHNSLKHTHNTHTLPVDDEIIVNRNRLFFFFCHLTIQYIYITRYTSLPFRHTWAYDGLRTYSNCVVPRVHRNISCAAAENRPREEIPNVFIMQVKKPVACAVGGGERVHQGLDKQNPSFFPTNTTNNNKIIPIRISYYHCLTHMHRPRGWSQVEISVRCATQPLNTSIYTRI